MSYLYPEYAPGWNVETTHPVVETEEEPVCETCLNGIAPAIAFALDWGATDFGATSTDPDGTVHTVVVRQIAP